MLYVCIRGGTRRKTGQEKVSWGFCFWIYVLEFMEDTFYSFIAVTIQEVKGSSRNNSRFTVKIPAPALAFFIILSKFLSLISKKET